MAAENAKRRIKRFLEPSTGDRIDQEKSEYGHVRSKRLKRMSHPEIAGGSNECRNEMQLKSDDENAAEGMAAKDAKKRNKRLSKESTTKRVNQGKTERSHVRSKRLKTMFHSEIAQASNECQNEMQIENDDENAAQGITTKDANRGKKRLLKRPIAKRINEGKTECSHVKSKRLKRMFCREINEKDNQCQSETEFRGNAENSVQGINEDLFMIENGKFFI